MAISQSKWEEKLVKADCLWRYSNNGPHVAYTLSDEHSDFYFNSDAFASNPSLINEAATELSASLHEAGLTEQPFWIVSYTGGVSASLVLAAGVSAKLNKRLAYLDIRTETLNFLIEANDAAIIVTDDIYSGGSIRKIMKLLQARGAKVLSPILTAGNLFGSDQLDGLKIISLIEHINKTWPSVSCPLCQAGSPAVSGRSNWQKLISPG